MSGDLRGLGRWLWGGRGGGFLRVLVCGDCERVGRFTVTVVGAFVAAAAVVVGDGLAVGYDVL